MRRVTVLTEAELRKVVKLDPAAVACVEHAFRALATLPVAMPPILRPTFPSIVAKSM
jgi:ornithine cyclodeaminase